MRKKVSVISSTITLAILIFLLVLTLNAKKATSEIWDATWRSIIPEGLVEDDSEMKSIFGNLFGGEGSESIFNNEELNKYIKEMTGETTETIEQFIEDQEQQLDPQQQMLINTLKFLSNVKIKYVLLLLMLLVICSICFMENSYFKWIRCLAWAMALSGGLTILFCELIKKYIFSYMKIEVTLNCLLDPAQYLILGGVIILIIYLIINSVLNINKKMDKIEKLEKEVENEVSKESKA